LQVKEEPQVDGAEAQVTRIGIEIGSPLAVRREAQDMTELSEFPLVPGRDRGVSRSGRWVGLRLLYWESRSQYLLALDRDTKDPPPLLGFNHASPTDPAGITGVDLEEEHWLAGNLSSAARVPPAMRFARRESSVHSLVRVALEDPAHGARGKPYPELLEDPLRSVGGYAIRVHRPARPRPFIRFRSRAGSPGATC
jgi:hypothetical protein